MRISKHIKENGVKINIKEEKLNKPPDNIKRILGLNWTQQKRENEEKWHSLEKTNIQCWRNECFLEWILILYSMKSHI